MNKTYYVEIRAVAKRQGQPRLVPLETAYQYSGFRTIVAYDEEVVAFIRAQGSTNNLRGLPVYADTLFMDFDSHDPTEFRTWLKGSGLAYTEWHSGGRSVHFHIPIEPVFSSWITVAMRDWTKQRAPTADVSFLHNAGLYRLPGTYHAKYPGKCKTLVAQQMGNNLVLTEPKTARLYVVSDSDEDARSRFFTMLMCAKSEGQRAPYLWLMATTAAEAGLEFTEALEHLRWWNTRLCNPPRDDLTVQRQCESAYRRQTRRNA